MRYCYEIFTKIRDRKAGYAVSAINGCGSTWFLFSTDLTGEERKMLKALISSIDNVRTKGLHKTNERHFCVFPNTQESKMSSSQLKTPETLRSARWFGPDDLRTFGHRSRMMQLVMLRKNFLENQLLGF